MIRTIKPALPLVLLALAGCTRHAGNPAPPRVEGAATLPQQSSTIVVPVTARLAELEESINRETPRTLWSIDRFNPKCVPAQRVKLGIRIKLVPDLGCRIVGQVTRGRITLGGSGDRLTIFMPVQARIAARNVGGFLKGKTATGAANVRAVATLSLRPDWSPAARVAIAYDWTEPPGIDFLGQRIEFVSKADDKLKGVIAGLERRLPRDLAKIRLRDRLADVWRQAFTSIELSRRNPPAWMRITPRRLGFGGYRIEGRQLTMVLAAEALTETFVGSRPPDPVPTPLPPPSRVAGASGLRFFIPVLAEYGELEPVVKRALDKLAARGITLTGIGPVDAKFGKVTVYATTGGRIAVGIEASVRARSSALATTKGVVWLSALPYNAPNSQRVEPRDLRIAGQTDSKVVDTLLALFDNVSVRESIRTALVHDFAPDYQKVLGKAQKAIGNRREGDFVLTTNVTDVRNGAIQATGAGLFLPVQAEGVARISYAPR